MRKVLWLLAVTLAHKDLVSSLHVRCHHGHANTSDADDCVPSFEGDLRDSGEWVLKNDDPVQRAELKQQGKIRSDGRLADLAFTHIPKNAGDAVNRAFRPLGVKIQGFAGSAGAQCYYSQLPPQKLAIVNPSAAQLQFGGKEVFCVVRDPFDKAISAACHLISYIEKVQPTPILVNDVIRTKLALFRSGHYNMNSCFWVPQSEYMKGPYGCTHPIDFRHIEREFNNITQSHGYNLALPRPNVTHHCTPRCHVTKGDLQPDVLGLIKDTYREDFERLGPMFGFEA